MDGKSLKQQIEQKLQALGRAKDSLKIVAVSKTKPLEDIDRLHKDGFRCFGENYVQEAIEKVSQRPQYEWHFIGSIQTNKLKDIVGNFKLIHSVDRLSVLEKISKIAQEKQVTQEVLLQVNFSKEETKSGFTAEDLQREFAQIMNIKGVNIQGLMVFPPPDDLAKSREDFRKGRDLANFLKLNELSMGTSHDYDIAIEEGATLIRLGTILFGERGRK